MPKIFVVLFSKTIFNTRCHCKKYIKIILVFKCFQLFKFSEVSLTFGTENIMYLLAVKNTPAHDNSNLKIMWELSTLRESQSQSECQSSSKIVNSPQQVIVFSCI